MRLEDLKKHPMVWLANLTVIRVFLTDTITPDESDPLCVYLTEFYFTAKGRWDMFTQSYLSERESDSWNHLVSNCEPISDMPPEDKYTVLKTLLGGMRA